VQLGSQVRLRRVPTVWRLRRVPTVRGLRRVPTAWLLQRVPLVWRLRRVPTVWRLQWVPMLLRPEELQDPPPAAANLAALRLARRGPVARSQEARLAGKGMAAAARDSTRTGIVQEWPAERQGAWAGRQARASVRGTAAGRPAERTPCSPKVPSWRAFAWRARLGTRRTAWLFGTTSTQRPALCCRGAEALPGSAHKAAMTQAGAQLASRNHHRQR